MAVTIVSGVSGPITFWSSTSTTARGDAMRGELTSTQAAVVDTYRDEVERLRMIALVAAIGTTLVLAGLTIAHRRQRRVSHEREVDRNTLFVDQTRRQRVQDAFEMSGDEGAAVRTLTVMLRQELGGWTTEALIADSSTAHLRRALATDPELGPRCQVDSPGDCPAIRRGTTLVFDRPDGYDACPHLRDRGITDAVAVCTPIKVAGKPVGITHSIAPDVGERGVEVVEEISRAFGDRIGVLRAFASTERQASRDPLTGLLNRRSIESRIRELDATGTAYSVAFCDLDHFKLLNDTHGHALGDRALRRFAAVLSDDVRPHDIVARWGGEEFVIVLPRTSEADARTALERIRESLARELLDARLPRFTFSAGIAQADDGDDFHDVVATADHALLVAKGLGRDRVVLANDELVGEAERAGLVPPLAERGERRRTVAGPESAADLDVTSTGRAVASLDDDVERGGPAAS